MPARIAGIQATWMFPGHSIPGTWVPAQIRRERISCGISLCRPLRALRVQIGFPADLCIYPKGGRQDGLP
jgi:hypothetical protein